MDLAKLYNVYQYSDSTMKSMTKSALISYIHCLQDNWLSSLEMNEIQRKEIHFLLNEASIETKKKFLSGDFNNIKENYNE